MKKFGVLLCIFWVGLIFYNSSQPATISRGVTGNIVSSIKEITKGASDELASVNVSYNSVGYSFKDVVKNIKSTVKTKINTWKNRSTTSKVYNFLRKLGHWSEFFVLAILVIFVLSKENIDNKDLIIRTLFIVIILAVLDEYLQSYIPGRGSLVSDVLIDFWGGIFGVLTFKFVSKITCKKEERIREKEIKIG